MKNTNLSKRTGQNFLLDAFVAFSALLASLSGIYFLFFPSNGYQGGRNPAYGLVLILSRTNWEALHTWSGVGIIALALIHLLLHWNWIASMSRRVINEIGGSGNRLTLRGWTNLGVDAAIAVSFLLSALSGLYFLWLGESHGGRALDPMILFTRSAWDVIHTWSSVLWIIFVVLHLAIHWRWVVNVAQRVLRLPVWPKVETVQS